MGTYYVRYYSDTASALHDTKMQDPQRPQRWTFHFPDQAVSAALSDSIRPFDQLHLHTGLNVFVHLGADSPHSALTGSKEFAEMLLNLVSFVTLAPCGSARVVSLLDISNESGVEAQFYSQWSEQHSPVYSPAITPLPHFDAVFRAYDSSSNADSERTAMALAWLRKGIGERNTVDEFLAYFFAMEIISCRLRDKLRFKVKDPGPWDGVKRILADKVGFTRFHDVREVRKGLVHGYRPLDRAFVEEITSYLKPLRKGVVFAIGDVIQVQDEILRAIADTTPRKAADLVSTLSGKLDGMPTDFDTVLDDYPSAELTERSMSLSIDDRGNLRATFKPSLNFRLPRGVVFKPMSTELRG